MMVPEVAEPGDPADRDAGGAGRESSGQPGQSAPVAPQACHDETELLGADEQRAYLELLQRGASPGVACRKLEISPQRVRRTERECAAFAMAGRDVLVQLSQNVAAALYQAAIKGSVPAQALWLKHVPPPEWQRGAGGGVADGEMAGDEMAGRGVCASAAEGSAGDELSGRGVRDYAELSDEELIRLARAVGFDIPAELASRAS